jgi:hypothetical protein
VKEPTHWIRFSFFESDRGSDEIDAIAAEGCADPIALMFETRGPKLNREAQFAPE